MGKSITDPLQGLLAEELAGKTGGDATPVANVVSAPEDHTAAARGGAGE